MLQEVFFAAANEGDNRTLKKAKKWLNEQERVDARMMARSSADGISGTSEHNMSCSAGTRRTGTRVIGSPACSVSPRTPG